MSNTTQKPKISTIEMAKAAMSEIGSKFMFKGADCQNTVEIPFSDKTANIAISTLPVSLATKSNVIEYATPKNGKLFIGFFEDGNKKSNYVIAEDGKIWLANGTGQACGAVIAKLAGFGRWADGNKVYLKAAGRISQSSATKEKVADNGEW